MIFVCGIRLKNVRNILILCVDYSKQKKVRNTKHNLLWHTFKWCLNLNALPHLEHLNLRRSGPSAWFAMCRCSLVRFGNCFEQTVHGCNQECIRFYLSYSKGIRCYCLFLCCWLPCEYVPFFVVLIVSKGCMRYIGW